MYEPKWLKECIYQYSNGISNTFILTGNIGDYGTTEPVMFIDYLVDYLNKSSVVKPNDVYEYIPYNGIKSRRSYNVEGTFDDFLSKIQESTYPSAFIITYSDYLIYEKENDASAIINLHRVINSTKYLNSKSITFILAESASSISKMFTGANSRASVVNVELPDKEERLKFIEGFFKKKTELKYRIKYERITNSVVANLTAGLQYASIEDILLYAASVGKINQKIIMEKKKEIISKEFGDVIEVFDTDGYSLDRFAGMKKVKGYFKDVIVSSMKSGDTSIVPKGIMFMGPPGTGKTYFARCMAADSGINFIEFKLSKILGKYVGESEKAMEKALSVFRALAPVGIFMDEIDQYMKRQGDINDGASSVNGNLFGMLLSEMSKSENRGKIIWIAATNYPNNVDEALKRAGRIDTKIPFFAPSRYERASVFKCHIYTCGMPVNSEITDEECIEFADETEGYTQAEIEAVVVKAQELAKRDKEVEMRSYYIWLALEYICHSQNKKISEMEDIALLECNDYEFIPDEYKERFRKLKEAN